MKKSILLLLIIISTQVVFSQDLIVTLTNDSLNCEITKIESEYIHFNMTNNEVVRNSVLMVSAIKSYQENFYSKSKSPSKQNSNTEYARLHFIISGGGSYLFDPVPNDVIDEIKDYYENLKMGYNLGFDVNYYFNKTIGLGLKYNYFNSSSSSKGSSSGNGFTSVWDISENIMVNFAGPTFLARFLSKKNKNAFILGVSVGYMWYKDDAVFFDPVIVRGNTFGLNIDASYHISLSDKFFLGFSASTTLGFLDSITFDDGQNTETFNFDNFSDYKNISRADISIKIGIKI